MISPFVYIARVRDSRHSLPPGWKELKIIINTFFRDGYTEAHVTNAVSGIETVDLFAKRDTRKQRHISVNALRTQFERDHAS